MGPKLGYQQEHGGKGDARSPFRDHVGLEQFGKGLPFERDPGRDRDAAHGQDTTEPRKESSYDGIGHEAKQVGEPEPSDEQETQLRLSGL